MCSSEFAFFPFGLATFCYLPSIFQSMEVEINYGNIILHFIYSRYLHSINSQTETRNRKSNFDHFLGEIKKKHESLVFLNVWVWWLKDIAFAMCMPCHAMPCRLNEFICNFLESFDFIQINRTSSYSPRYRIFMSMIVRSFLNNLCALTSNSAARSFDSLEKRSAKWNECISFCEIDIHYWNQITATRTEFWGIIFFRRYVDNHFHHRLYTCIYVCKIPPRCHISII